MALRQRPLAGLARPSADAMAEATRFGSASGARLTNATPPSKCRRELAGDLHRQPGLAGAARAGQRHQADVRLPQPGGDDGDLRRAPDQRRALRRQPVPRPIVRGAPNARGRPWSTPAAIAVSSASTSAAVGRAAACLLEHPPQQPLEAWRHVRHALRGARRVVRDDRVQLRERGLRFERMRAGGELVEDDAEREHVARRAGALAARLLRRHVARRAEDHVGAGVARQLARGRAGRGQQARQPEVEQLDVAVARAPARSRA